MDILILLSILVFLLMLPIIYIKVPNQYFKHQMNFTIYYLQNFVGYLIAIIAKIRTGKTTLMSGLSHLLQIIIINKNIKIMKDIRDIFYKINFNTFESIIITELNEGNYDLNKITDFLIYYFKLNGDQLYFSFLSFDNCRALIFDYVEAFYVINFRQQYVYSKTYFYSHITNKPNIKYDLEWTKIKDAFKNKNYAIYDNMIELVDEATDDIGAGKNFDDIKDESGAKEYRRKFGHLHKEKNYFIISKQDSSDEVKRFRNLTQSNMEIVEKVNVVGSYKLLNKLLQFIYNCPDHINHFKFNIIALFKGMVFQEDRDRYIDFKIKGSKFGRKFKNKIYYIQKFLFSLSYCQFKIHNYSREEDVGKENTTSKHYYDEVNFIIPLKYCFGSFTRFEYNYIQNELIKNSKIQFEDLLESLMFTSQKQKYFTEVDRGGGSYYED